MADYELYTLRVSTLTPLHIGSGVNLLHEYDYAIRGGRTWRINEAALLDAQQVDDPRLVEQLARTPPARLLKDDQDYQEGAAFFRYVIQGVPRSSAEGAQIREQIKDPFDQVYLPGSSLKGALRTALAWHAWSSLGLKLEENRLGSRRKRAAQEYEKEIFGRSPNHDLMRALQVADSRPLDPQCLMILNVRVLNRSGALGSPIEVEAVRPDTTFELTLKLDRALVSDWAKKRGLRLQGFSWLEKLGSIVNAHTAQRVQDERRWAQPLANGGRLVNFYDQLAKAALDERRYLIQVGWGTGWDDKTFGSRLRANPEAMERLLERYRLVKGRRNPGDPFPKSRRVAVSITRSPTGEIVENPAYPLGWVLVEMEQVERLV